MQCTQVAKITPSCNSNVSKTAAKNCRKPSAKKIQDPSATFKNKSHFLRLLSAWSYVQRKIKGLSDAGNPVVSRPACFPSIPQTLDWHLQTASSKMWNADLQIVQWVTQGQS